MAICLWIAGSAASEIPNEVVRDAGQPERCRGAELIDPTESSATHRVVSNGIA
jgi:hypothetical protein